MSLNKNIVDTAYHTAVGIACDLDIADVTELDPTRTIPQLIVTICSGYIADIHCDPKFFTSYSYMEALIILNKIIKVAWQKYLESANLQILSDKD